MNLEKCTPIIQRLLITCSLFWVEKNSLKTKTAPNEASESSRPSWPPRALFPLHEKAFWLSTFWSLCRERTRQQILGHVFHYFETLLPFHWAFQTFMQTFMFGSIFSHFILYCSHHTMSVPAVLGTAYCVLGLLSWLVQLARISLG